MLCRVSVKWLDWARVKQKSQAINSLAFFAAYFRGNWRTRSALSGKPYINFVHVIIVINGREKGFYFFQRFT